MRLIPNIICSSLFLKMKMKKRGFILINLLERSLTWICGFRLGQKNLTRESTKKIQLITRSNNRSVKVELPDATFTVVPMSYYYNPSNAWFRYNPRCWWVKELTFWFRFRKQMFSSVWETNKVNLNFQNFRHLLEPLVMLDVILAEPQPITALYEPVFWK